MLFLVTPKADVPMCEHSTTDQSCDRSVPNYGIPIKEVQNVSYFWYSVSKGIYIYITSIASLTQNTNINIFITMKGLIYIYIYNLCVRVTAFGIAAPQLRFLGWVLTHSTQLIALLLARCHHYVTYTDMLSTYPLFKFRKGFSK